MTNTIEIKRSVAKEIAACTILAAFTTVDCYGPPSASIAEALRGDLDALSTLEDSPIVTTAKELVGIAIEHSLNPTTETFDRARIVRDKLGDMLINAKEIRG